MRPLDPAGLARLRARPGVAAVLSALDAPGAETRLVGGCVRDALLGQDAADIDCATTLLPEAVMARARAAGLKAVPTGLAHGTVTLVAEGAPIEVTTQLMSQASIPRKDVGPVPVTEDEPDDLGVSR